jgi:hypothetical protein
VLCVPEGPGSRKEATTDSLGRPGRRVRNYQTRFSWFHQVSSCVSTFLSETPGLPACVCDQLIQPFQADILVVSKIRSRGGGRRRQHLRPGSVRARGRLDRTSIARYFSNGSGSFNHFFHHRYMPMYREYPQHQAHQHTALRYGPVLSCEDHKSQALTRIADTLGMLKI